MEKAKRELKKLTEGKPIPDPGTDEAIREGCICPVMDNHHGAGAFVNSEDLFWITEDCPVHDQEK